MKAFWKSKTLWVNVLSGAALVLNKGGVVPIAGDKAALALAGINIALRLLTNTGLSVREPAPAADDFLGV